VATSIAELAMEKNRVNSQSINHSLSGPCNVSWWWWWWKPKLSLRKLLKHREFIDSQYATTTGLRTSM